VHGKVHAHTKCRDEYVLLSIQQQESSGTEVLSGRMGNLIPFQCLNNKFILSKLISSQPSPCTERYFNQLGAKSFSVSTGSDSEFLTHMTGFLPVNPSFQQIITG